MNRVVSMVIRRGLFDLGCWAVIVLVASAPALLPGKAQAQPGNAKDVFTITLPAAWRELSPEQMRELRQLNHEDLPVPLDGRVHIYKPGNSTNALEPPFVFVHIATSGRVPDHFMRRIVATNDSRRELAAYLQGIGVYESNLRNLSFDTNSVSMKFDAVQPTAGSLNRALTKVFFTEEGTITASAVTTELDFPKWSATFGQIADSVTVSERVRYRLRPPPDLSSGSRDWLVFGGAVVVLLVLCGGWFYFSQMRGASTLEY